MVMCQLHRTRPRMPAEAPEKKSPGVPGLKRCDAKRLRFRELLGFVLELLDRDVRDHRTQLLRRLEHGHRPRGDLHGRTRARIACHARLPMSNLERAEAAHLDVLLFLE